MAKLANHDNGKVKILGAGGIDVILEAMKAHLTIAEVQEDGCRALGNLASNNDNGKVKIVGAGSIG